MSDYSVIFQVSKKLKQVLWNAFQQEPEIKGIVGTSDSAIVFLHPSAAARNASNRLSLWLYQVTENEFVKNQPLQTANGNNQAQLPPLALNLFYLITPFGAASDTDPAAGESDLRLLGKTMQVLYDNAIIYLADQANNVFEELRVVLSQLTLEEQTRVWEALQEPYRLSVNYQVRVIHLDSQRTVNLARVAERTAGLTDTVPQPGEAML
ncbi:MAG TPA: DUF4255 domain-containing protein [Gemmataceae bacterium]